jgi:hypothetical protein
MKFVELSEHKMGCLNKDLNSEIAVGFFPRVLTAGSKRTAEIVVQGRKPAFLYIDLQQRFPTESAEILTAWIKAHGISVLDVVGSRASKDLNICDRLRTVTELAL